MRGNRRHASMIDGAVPQEAGPAEDGFRNELMRAERARRPLVGGTEVRDDGTTQRGREVHGS